LPRIRIYAETPKEVCSICQEEMELDQIAIRMPCSHLYHADCLEPWLKEHNTCPLDRYELLTDDEEYNKNVVLKQILPVKTTNNTIYTTNTTNQTNNKDSDVETSNNSNPSSTDSMTIDSTETRHNPVVDGNSTKDATLLPEIGLIMEELKRQVSSKQHEDLQLDSLAAAAADEATNSNALVLRNSVKRKRESDNNSVEIEDITGREEEFDL